MIRIVIVSELGLVRGALDLVLSTEDGVSVVASVGTEWDATHAVREHRPHVALVDLDGVKLDGLRAARTLADLVPAPAVVALTSRHQPVVLRRALAAGVQGFASKEQTPGELTASIRRVARGDRVIHPQTALASLAAAENPLTEREQQLLRLAAQGMPTGSIARTLYLTEGTVRNYLSVVLRKLGTRNRLEAARKAREAGWL